MFFRRQKIESKANIFFDEKIIVEIFEIQSKTKITISTQNVFEKKSSSNMTSITKIQDFLAQVEIERKIDFFVASVSMIETKSIAYSK